MKFRTSVEIEIDADNFRAAGAYLDGVCARIGSHAVPPSVNGVQASVLWLELDEVVPDDEEPTARLAHVG